MVTFQKQLFHRHQTIVESFNYLHSPHVSTPVVYFCM